MKIDKKIIFLLVGVMVNQSFAGIEVDNALGQVNDSLAMGLTGLNLDYKEIFPVNSPLKSTEAGTAVGFFLDIRKALQELVYTDLYLDYYNGGLTYDGVARDQPHTPMKYGAEHKFFNANAKVGPILVFTETNSLQVIPYIGVGYRYWYRQHNNIRLQEKYQHYKITAGLKLHWLLTEHFIVSSYIEGGKIISARMKFCGEGKNTGEVYKLGNEPIYTAGLELNYNIFDEFFFNSFVNYTQFKYGRSIIDKNSFYEPDSKTREIRAGVGIRYSWLVN